MTQVLIVDDARSDRELVRSLLQERSSVEVAFADNGADALEEIKRCPPTMVVTDLQMPKLDGLELVEAIRRDFPSIPVVLMTGEGSEDLAVKAMKKGAASYVPKALLARDLFSTVMQVLAVARADRDYRQMQKCWQECHCEFELPADHNLIGPVVGQLGRLVEGMQLFDDTEQVQLSMALEEAISNALYHGNLELTVAELKSTGYNLLEPDATNLVDERSATAPYKDRKVFVAAILTRGEARFVIRDQGPGFDHTTVPAPEEAVSSADLGGRRLTHMRLFSDEITFGETGNDVTLVKKTRTGRQDS